MEKANTSKMNWTRKCIECDVNFCIKDAFVLHLLGKRHQKKVRKRDKSHLNDVRERTMGVTVNGKVAVEKIVEFFVDYGVTSASHHGNTVFIEFDTVEAAQKVIKKKNFRIRTASLRVFPFRPRAPPEDFTLRLSQYLKNCLSQPVTGGQLDKHISFLIKEIELKPREFQARESLRRGIVNYLLTYFPRVQGYIFGSSANNLGFSGCDIDLYIDCGVYPWLEAKTEAASREEAKDLTMFLARKIRQSGKAVKVEAIARARVPIVKFQDRSSRILVDLSFRNAMAVYNTQLINQYTRTHPLVRPYLMMIRYWAKIQGVSGGGRPSFLITNYALTMMMLFYLMCRNDPIVPSVSCLRSNWAGHIPTFIGPWDVGFGSNVNEWFQRYHNVSVMELVSEFFSYFGKLETSKWVISPLVGRLLDRHDITMKSRSLPQCLETFLQQFDVIKLEAPLHIQDPFEHCHNCTKGLSEVSLLEFQVKCRKAALTSDAILKGEQTLNDLFQPIEMTTDVIRDVFQTSSQEDEDEVITLDDSELSQDCQVLSSPKRKGQDDDILAGPENTSDIEILPTPKKAVEEILLDPQEADQDIEILSCHEGALDSFKRQKCEDKSESSRNLSDDSVIQSGTSADLSKDTKQIFNERIGMSLTKGEGSSSSELNMDSINKLLPVVVHQLEKCSSFFLDYSQVPELKITPDGDVLECGEKLFDDSEIGQAACVLVEFALKKCLKIELTLENSLPGEKRKALLQGDETSAPKRVKSDDGKSASLPAKYLKISKYTCLSTQALWNGRKKISKKVARKVNETPLQYELAVTEAQMGQLNSLQGNCPFEFIIEVWQELDNPNFIHVTGSTSQTKLNQSMMIPMFSYFSSLCKNLLKKLTHHVKHSMH